METIKSGYYFLGQNQTAKLLGFISGFTSGLTMVPGYIFPIIMGIVSAVISSLIAGFINWLLPEVLKPVFGLLQLISLLIFIFSVAGALKLTSTVMATSLIRRK